jgi:hypothetical protein
MTIFKIIRRNYYSLFVVLAAIIFLANCADLKVTKVTNSNNASVKGIRYYLPKPYLQVTPQADGTILVDVIYLPDKSQAYAIDASSQLSSYTFQASRDEKGILTAIEYKASTTAVGQQLAASAGAAAVQAYNVSAAQQTAVQSLVNTAAANVDVSNANLQAAIAALANDKAMGANTTILLSDNNAVAQTQAKLQAAQQALQRVRNSTQVTGTTIASGPLATTTAPTMGTIFGQQTWTTATVANLPNKFAPVLFAINDTISGEKENVGLNAIRSEIPGSSLATNAEVEEDVTKEAQHTFETVATALGPPTLFPLAQMVSSSNKKATVSFSRGIDNISTAGIYTDPDNIDMKKVGILDSDSRTISFDISGLSPRDYVISATFTYYVADGQASSLVTLKTKLTIIK